MSAQLAAAPLSPVAGDMSSPDDADEPLLNQCEMLGVVLIQP